MAHTKQHTIDNKRKFIEVEAKESKKCNMPELSEEDDYEEDEEQEEENSDIELSKKRSERESKLRPDEKRGLIGLREERDGYREEIADLYAGHQCFSDMINCVKLLNRRIHKQIKGHRFEHRHCQEVISHQYLKMKAEEQKYYKWKLDILGDNESQCSLGIRAILGYEDDNWNLNRFSDVDSDDYPSVHHNDTPEQ